MGRPLRSMAPSAMMMMFSRDPRLRVWVRDACAQLPGQNYPWTQPPPASPLIASPELGAGMGTEEPQRPQWQSVLPAANPRQGFLSPWGKPPTPRAEGGSEVAPKGPTRWPYISGVGPECTRNALGAFKVLPTPSLPPRTQHTAGSAMPQSPGTPHSLSAEPRGGNRVRALLPGLGATPRGTPTDAVKPE